ncbi:putative aminodeoxychorismate lyase [Candidatus Arcanobacter lacustris]|jgi:UPF0755 protein|uniref:Endolytic murein transglycosylase n=1 Tax=Candidatus Arcanibacter lacustris TaxID=1607817 RepID=A0A0F5MNM4_9RICK|nr:putative aminodeoxychorismate lyase [Candidatus Arcanobacter lacustris]
MIRHFLIGSFIVLSVILTLSSGLYVFLNMKGPLLQDKIIILHKGESLKDFSEKLAQEKIIEHPKTMLFAMRLVNSYNRIKAGEYMLHSSTGMGKILNTLVEGKSIIHKLTIAEGTTTKQILDRINAETILTGEIEEEIPEGALLPETYFFTYGDTKEGIIKRMRDNMDQALDYLWENRKVNAVIKTKEEALVLASIIEKETGLSSERKKVSAVFINRLNKHMKLQADPTTIYGVTLGKYELTRELSRKDLASNSPYNTYHVYGLPPTPITNPGRASIEAALNPDETNDIFFVADGTGGHKFSSNLKEHNNNVRSFRNNQ